MKRSRKGGTHRMYIGKPRKKPAFRYVKKLPKKRHESYRYVKKI